MKEIILDTETTGLSVKDDHRILEIACIETENLFQQKRFFTNLLTLIGVYRQMQLRFTDTQMNFKNKQKFSDIEKSF